MCIRDRKKAAFEEEAEPAAELIMTAREPYIPRFISGEEAVQGTQYGTAVHKVMELLSFDASYQNVPSDKVYMGKIWGEMQTWIAEGRVQKEDIACVNTSRIASFFHSNLAKRMISAQQRGELYREQPFVLGLPTHELKEQYPSEETVLIPVSYTHLSRDMDIWRRKSSRGLESPITWIRPISWC